MRPSYDRVRLGKPQTVRRFTLAEDALMTELRIAGMGTTEIAAHVSALGTLRSQGTISMRLKALAAAEDRAEERETWIEKKNA